jgi:hypothetical protein
LSQRRQGLPPTPVFAQEARPDQVGYTTIPPEAAEAAESGGRYSVSSIAPSFFRTGAIIAQRFLGSLFRKFKISLFLKAAD